MCCVYGPYLQWHVIRWCITTYGTDMYRCIYTYSTAPQSATEWCCHSRSTLQVKGIDLNLVWQHHKARMISSCLILTLELGSKFATLNIFEAWNMDASWCIVDSQRPVHLWFFCLKLLTLKSSCKLLGPTRAVRLACIMQTVRYGEASWMS